jgi:hypothetical protein
VILAIRVPEERRVAQPRRDDALGVLRDLALVGRLRVDDGEERLFQRALVVEHREVMLVMDQRGRQHFLRQFEERTLEEAGDDPGILDEVGNFIEQRGMLAQVNTSAELARFGFELARDPIRAAPSDRG